MYSYIFYFRYFFKDKYYIGNLRYLESLEKNEQEECKNIIVTEIKKIENTKNIEELIKTYNIYMSLGKIQRGKDLLNSNKRLKILKGQLSNITNFFMKKAYIKQLYVLLLEDCYFNNNKGNVKDKTKVLGLRYMRFKREYERMVGEQTYSDNYCRLVFALPPATVSINEEGKMSYCYQIDELQNIELQNTSIFFSISFLQLIESGIKISKCENCNSFFILKKENTRYCNNFCPQNPKQTCSNYMKAINYKSKTDTIEKDIAKAEKRANDRLTSHYTRYRNEKERKTLLKQREEWKIEKDKEKCKYKKGLISEKQYIDWLNTQNIYG